MGKSSRKVVILENTEARKVVIKNIAWGSTEQELKKILDDAKEVINVQTIRDGEGKDKGHRVVEFKTRNEANKAKRVLNNRELRGRPIHVTGFKEESRTESLEFISKLIGESVGPAQQTILRGTPSSQGTRNPPNPPSPPPPPGS